MKLFKQFSEGAANSPVKIPVLKPRNPNQGVLANKKNAGGPMKDKKRAILNGEPKHRKDIYEREIKTGDRVTYDNYNMWKNDLPKGTYHRTEGAIEFAQSIGKELEGISGKWNSTSKTGWIYEYYLNPKNLHEAKIIKAKEPGWYIVDHMDKPVEGPMQEGAARRGAVEMTKDHDGDIPAFDVLYFSDYDIKRLKEDVQLLEKGKWNDSGASDANGRWAKYAKGEIGVGAMATWLYNSRVHKKTKAEKLKSAYGAISQQENTSKLISSAKADALRSALKKQQNISESAETSAKYAFRLTFSHGASTDWDDVDLHFASTEEIAAAVLQRDADLGFITTLVEPILGIPAYPHSYIPGDVELLSHKYDQVKIELEYGLQYPNSNEDPFKLHTAVLTIQARG